MPAGVDDGFTGEVEIEGVVQEVDAQANTIIVHNVTVAVDDASQFQVGQKVEVKGRFSNGRLAANTTELEQEDTVRTEGNVASKDPEAGTLTTRLGVEIRPTGVSHLGDDITDDDSPTVTQFLANMQIGDRIEARGYPGAGSVIWTRIEREDDDDLEYRLRGPVASIDVEAFSFVIQDVTIATRAGIEFEHSTGSALTQAQFFNNLSVGSEVQATSSDGGGCANGTPDAKEVEFESSDDS